MEKGVDMQKGETLSQIDINPEDEFAVEEESDNDDLIPDGSPFVLPDIFTGSFFFRYLI